MNTVEKVKAICKERKLPISRLEKDLGYANGYIGQLRKGTFPNDRLVEIANYLGVSTAYLTGETSEVHVSPQRTITDNDIKFALFGGSGEITDAMYEEVRSFAAYVLAREEGKRKE